MDRLSLQYGCPQAGQRHPDRRRRRSADLGQALFGIGYRAESFRTVPTIPSAGGHQCVYLYCGKRKTRGAGRARAEHRLWSVSLAAGGSGKYQSDDGNLIVVTVNYCSLKIHMVDEEYGDWYEVDNHYALSNELAIRELLQKGAKKLIDNLMRDFLEVKDGFEYAGYLAKPSKGTVLKLISRPIDDNVDLIGKRENYVLYIAKRPRAEWHGTHGLFTDTDVPINLSQVASEVANHDGNVWTHIISLHREDADRSG